MRPWSVYAVDLLALLLRGEPSRISHLFPGIETGEVD
jgi:hypothetical protein